MKDISFADAPARIACISVSDSSHLNYSAVDDGEVP
jgi:hypothetical protein